jgi:hypothetical protein
MVEKYSRIFAIYVSLVITWVDSLARKVIGRSASSAKIDEFITNNGLSKASTANDVSRALLKNFIWRADKPMFDYAKAPQEFLYDGKDDCDGFAMFAEEILNRMGFEDVFRMYVRADNDKGHAICVAKFSDGFYWELGNWNEIQFSSSLIQDMGKVIAMKMGGNLSFCMKFKKNSYCEYFSQ